MSQLCWNFNTKRYICHETYEPALNVMFCFSAVFLLFSFGGMQSMVVHGLET
jgi:hypothetical protein